MPGGSGFGWFLVAPGQLVTRPVLPQGAGDSFGVPSPGWGRVVRGREPGHRFLLCQWPRMIQAGTRPFPTLPGRPGSPLGGVRLAGPCPWEQPVVWGEGRGEGRPVLTAAWGCCGGRPGNGSPPGGLSRLILGVWSMCSCLGVPDPSLWGPQGTVGVGGLPGLSTHGLEQHRPESPPARPASPGAAPGQSPAEGAGVGDWGLSTRRPLHVWRGLWARPRHLLAFWAPRALPWGRGGRLLEGGPAHCRLSRWLVPGSRGPQS